MKDELGFATLEMMVAIVIIVISISAVILLVTTSQSMTVDGATTEEALYKAQTLIEEARAESRSDFGSVVTTEPLIDDIYQRQTIVDQSSLTQCSKDVKTSVAWNIEGRSLNVDLTSHFTDVLTALSLGGNCDSNPPTLNGWNPPATWASSSFYPGRPTSLDVFDRIVYMTADIAPYLFIANTNGVSKGTSSGLFTTFVNGFDAGAKLNDIKVAKASNDRVYAFVARDTLTDQLGIIDVTNINNPTLIANKTLTTASGSFPQGFRVYYFDKKVYILTRETANNEFHIFNMATPWDSSSIAEYGTGFALNRTVENFVVTKKLINNTVRYFAYMATDKLSAELTVLEVTNPSLVEELTGANVNLPGTQDGISIFLVGNNLYLGRQSVPSASDFYVFDASVPYSATTGLPIINQADVGTGVIGMAVSGLYSFFATTKTNSEFQVWTSDPSQTINKIALNGFSFENLVQNGIKYENDWVYVASTSNDSLKILYNNP